MHIHTLIQPDGLDFVRDKGKVVFVEQAHSPGKDQRGCWAEAIRTDDNTIHQPHQPNVVLGEPVFSIQGGRVYATFPLVSEEKIMSRHCYCLVDADGTILRVTEPLEKAPPPEERYGVRMIWQQVPITEIRASRASCSPRVSDSPESLMSKKKTWVLVSVSHRRVEKNSRGKPYIVESEYRPDPPTMCKSS